MKTNFYTNLWRVCAISLLTLVVVFSSHAADEVIVYKHCNYDPSGYAVRLSIGNYTSADLVYNGIAKNDISSIQVESGYEIVLYDGENFGGASVVVRTNTTCLTSLSFNDKASSLRIRAVPVTAYPQCSYGGTGVSLAVGTYTSAQLSTLGISNNDLSSLKIKPGYEIELFDNDNFSGSSVNIQQHTSCLDALTFDNKTTSLKVVVLPNTPPVITAIVPDSSITYVAPATVTMFVDAYDVEGTITKIQIFKGTTAVATLTTAPYSYTWTNLPEGVHLIKVKATDNVGATTIEVWKVKVVSSLRISSATEYNVYFNASDENIYLSSGTSEMNHVMVYNAQGVLLKETFVSGSGTFNAADLPQGLCIIRIENASGVSYQDKLMIKR